MKSFFMLLAMAFLSVTSFAKSHSKIEVSDARIFAPIKGSTATAGYATFKNTSKKSVTLTLTKVEPFKAAEMHETVEKEGRMAMQKVDQLTIQAGHGLELKPGGNHIMLFDANREIKEDEVLQVEMLVNGKPEAFDFKVISRVSKKDENHHH